jgi:predicted DCC family thiol-disulfide oxidoreductase YuxK
MEVVKMNVKKDKKTQFFYDGECPICSHFVCKINDSNNKIELINAREQPELVEMAKAKNLDIDEGAIVIANEQIFYGPEAMIYLAKNLNSFGVFGGVFKGLFRFNIIARSLYPTLVSLRKLLLKVKRKSLINQEPDKLSKSISVYYNSACPVCDSGIQGYRKKENAENIIWKDIHYDQSSIDNLNRELEVSLDLEFVRKRLHLVDQNGELKVGIDAFIVLWKISESGQWKARFFSFPIIHGLSSLCYNSFAWLLYRWNRLVNHW